MNPFLTADYCDGRVRIGSKTYAAGAYVVHLLNQYYRNDTAARLGVYKQHGWNAAEQIAAGYLKETEYLTCSPKITQSKLRISFTAVPLWKVSPKLSWIWIYCRRNMIKSFSKTQIC